MRKRSFAVAAGLALLALSCLALSGCAPSRVAAGCVHDVLTIHDSGISVEMSGFCETLVVDGDHDSVGDDEAYRVTINGNNCDVPFADATLLIINGSSNSAQGTGAGEIEIRGDHNRITIDGSVDTVQVGGTRNSVNSDETISHRIDTGRLNSIVDGSDR